MWEFGWNIFRNDDGIKKNQELIWNFDAISGHN